MLRAWSLAPHVRARRETSAAAPSAFAGAAFDESKVTSALPAPRQSPARPRVWL